MKRTAIWATIGCALGFLSPAVFGFWYGFRYGGPSARLTPGMEAAFVNAFVCAFYFGLPLGAVCAAFGAVTGFGSWLVRPREHSKGDWMRENGSKSILGED